MEKIKFNDKQNSVLTNSIYVLNANNINEIKTVVNNLIEYFDITNFNFYNVFKFINISIPNFYKENYYEIEFNFSNKSNFNGFYRISSVENQELFYIFEEGKYINFKDLNKIKVNKNDLEKQILIDISSISLFMDIENIDLRKYYGRYRFKMGDNYSQYFGIVLGNTEFNLEKVQLKSTQTIIDSNKLSSISFDNDNIKNFELISYDVKEKDTIKLKTFLYDGKQHIDVTNITKYETIINDQNIKFKLEDNIFFLDKINNFTNITILAETDYNFEKIYSKINLNLIPNNILYNKDLNFYLNNDINNQFLLEKDKKYSFESIFSYINSKSDYSEVKYSDDNKKFDFIYDESLIKLESGTIQVQDIDKHIISKILIKYGDFEKEIPFTIKDDDRILGIEVELSETKFNDASLNNSYNVFLINTNNEKIDITNKTNVIILNDKTTTLNNEIYNSINFNKDNKTYDVSKFSSSFEQNILFEYYDEKYKKYYKVFKKISLNKNLIMEKIDININDNFEIHETGSYTIKLKLIDKETGEQFEEDITKSCEIEADECLILNNGELSISETCKCDIFDQKQYLIMFKYSFNGNIYKKEKIITVYRRPILNILIEGQDILSAAIPSDKYKVLLTYTDNETVDITDNPNLKLVLHKSSNGILYDNKITPDILHDPHNIILNAEYKEDGCDNLIYYASKNIYVLPYRLDYTEILSENDFIIYSNKSDNFYTNAYYTNEMLSTYISAKYTLSDLNGKIFNQYDSPVISSYNEETNTINLFAKKTLTDKELILSSYYEEPGYELTENSLVSEKIKIIGGFNVKLYGTLLTSNGNSLYETDFESLSSVHIKDFSTDDEEIKNKDFGDFSIDFTFEELYKEASYNLFGENEDSKIDTDGNYIIITPTNVNRYFHNINLKIKKMFNYIAKIYRYVGNSDELQFINKIDTGLTFKFEKGIKYKIKFCSIASLEGSKFSKHTFEINKDLENNYIVGFTGLYFESGFQLINPKIIFETINGVTYESNFKYIKENDLWFIKDVPKKANKIKSIEVSYAFNDNEFRGE